MNQNSFLFCALWFGVCSFAMFLGIFICHIVYLLNIYYKVPLLCSALNFLFCSNSRQWLGTFGLLTKIHLYRYIFFVGHICDCTFYVCFISIDVVFNSLMCQHEEPIACEICSNPSLFAHASNPFIIS